jgi:hypothetical protein
VKAKNKKSADWHTTTGRMMKRMCRELSALWVSVSDADGKTGKVTRRAKRAADAVGVLRHLLEEMYFRDSPDKFDVKTYYGPD